MRFYREQVTSALDALAQGLGPVVERELTRVYGDRWQTVARDSFRSGRGRTGAEDEPLDWDAHSTLTVMWDQWNNVFRDMLTQPDRSLVSELREFRNRWAHQAEFNFDDAYRVLDSTERLLSAVRSDRADEVAHAKRTLLRAEYDQQARHAYQRSKARRRNYQDLAVYSGCGVAIVFAIVQGYGWDAWYMVVTVVVIFAVIIWQRLVSPPATFGAHECLNCGKIIYTDDCPYCEPQRWRRADEDLARGDMMK